MRGSESGSGWLSCQPHEIFFKIDETTGVKCKNLPEGERVEEETWFLFWGLSKGKKGFDYRFYVCFCFVVIVFFLCCFFLCNELVND